MSLAPSQDFYDKRFIYPCATIDPPNHMKNVTNVDIKAYLEIKEGFKFNAKTQKLQYDGAYPRP